VMDEFHGTDSPEPRSGYGAKWPTARRVSRMKGPHARTHHADMYNTILAPPILG
jgi:hypothetical protein